MFGSLGSWAKNELFIGYVAGSLASPTLFRTRWQHYFKLVDNTRWRLWTWTQKWTSRFHVQGSFQCIAYIFNLELSIVFYYSKYMSFVDIASEEYRYICWSQDRSCSNQLTMFSSRPLCWCNQGCWRQCTRRSCTHSNPATQWSQDTDNCTRTIRRLWPEEDCAGV